MRNPLAVSGNQIVDRVSGTPVVLRGVNRSGLEYSRNPIPASDFTEIIEGWGAQVVRLPFNQEWVMEDASLLDAAVAAVTERDAYAILDLQWLDNHTPRGFDNNGRPNFVPALPNDASVELWRTLAARYRDNPAVLYDILNEPHDPLPGDDPALPERITATEWEPWAAALVGAIRSESPDALILVSGLNWAYDLSAYPLESLSDVVYSTHVYSNKGSDWDGAFGDVAEFAPVFAGEWGGYDVTWGRRLAAYLAERGIGWTAWSWCDDPYIRRDGVVTPYGELVRELLAGA